MILYTTTKAEKLMFQYFKLYVYFYCGGSPVELRAMLIHDVQLTVCFKFNEFNNLKTSGQTIQH